MHRVTPLKEATEDRISFVISLMRTDVFAEDTTRTMSNISKEPYEMISWEFAKHTAWKAKG